MIDACVHQLEDGTWRLWYNDEPSGKQTFFADSPDLRSWSDRGQAVGDQPGEGPNVFRWRGSYWMVVDVWDGLAVYRSDDALTWARQPGTILRDDPRAHHADVLVREGRALLYYFPRRASGPARWGSRSWACATGASPPLDRVVIKPEDLLNRFKERNPPCAESGQ
ncbi:glycoside hydrolase family protein [Nonomuraea recticatena]|uniref:hypothetical protein n=1 Tax=Nonomuraea recticatena TaxID=46178 RepID=UPI00361E7919